MTQLDVRAKVPTTLLKRKDSFLRGLALCSLKDGMPARPQIDESADRRFFFKRLSGPDAETFVRLRDLYGLTTTHLVEAALAAVDGHAGV